jgi:hypothetical protein
MQAWRIDGLIEITKMSQGGFYAGFFERSDGSCSNFHHAQIGGFEVLS